MAFRFYIDHEHSRLIVPPAASSLGLPSAKCHLPATAEIRRRVRPEFGTRHRQVPKSLRRAWLDHESTLSDPGHEFFENVQFGRLELIVGRVEPLHLDPDARQSRLRVVRVDRPARSAIREQAEPQWETGPGRCRDL